MLRINRIEKKICGKRAHYEIYVVTLARKTKIAKYTFSSVRLTYMTTLYSLTRKALCVSARCVAVLIVAFAAAFASEAEAKINITSGQMYTFQCARFNVSTYNSGYMVLGVNHDAAPYIYYYATLTEPSADAYWVITAKDNGYTIRNSYSNEYLVYQAGRTTNENGEYTAKGLVLSSTDSDENAIWTFTEDANGYIIVENVGTPGQYFNVRTDGSLLVGTYENYAATNGLFIIKDTAGISVVTSESSEGDDSGSTDEATPISGTSGMDGDCYWELTGLAQPIVYTTDTSNPVLYYIRNIRSGKYVGISNKALNQNTSKTLRFYFVQDGSSTIIYSEDGNYVLTNYAYNARSTSLVVNSGTTSGANLWAFGYASELTSNVGYTICKQDNTGVSYNGGTPTYQSAYLYWNDLSQTGICLYDVDAGSTFVFESADTRHISYLLNQGIRFDGYVPSTVEGFVDSLRIGGKDLVYDLSANEFFATIPTSARGGDLATTLSVKIADVQTTSAEGDDVTTDTYALYFDGEEMSEGDNDLNIFDIDCEKAYPLEIVKNNTETVATANLYFTFLPIVEINVASANSSSYTLGTIRVTDASQEGRDTTMISGFKYRGATALSYSKKSYAIKLKDPAGGSLDAKLLGLRNDNKWILDAMVIDKACMRNRVSTDLWNDFATEPYHAREGWEKKVRTGTRGGFVEVFLNGTYHGLYCLTEKIDRKQLKLQKFVAADAEAGTADTIHSTLYKSTNWGYECFFGHSSNSSSFPKTTPQAYNNSLKSETYANQFEIKHPDWEEEGIDWGPLWNAINFTATSSDSQFDDGVYDWFDMPVALDYYLFIELLLATDNHGKNMFFFNYDQLGKKYAKKIGIAPWDLDGTWGRRWDGSKTYTGASQNFDDFLWSYEHGQFTLFYRMQNSVYWNWAENLKTRYAKLRNEAFREDALIKRFTDYRDLFVESHADAREQKKWSRYHSDISGDVDFIESWIKERLAFLDEQYGFDVSTGLNTSLTADDAHITATGGNGSISVHATETANVRIYTVGGQLVRNVRLDQPHAVLTGFAPGVYVVNDIKVVVR